MRHLQGHSNAESIVYERRNFRKRKCEREREREISMEVMEVSCLPFVYEKLG